MQNQFEEFTFEVAEIQRRILTIRGVQVMVDRDLAQAFQVPTKRLNEQVKRNADRFPAPYMFQLSKEEMSELVANCDRFASMKHSVVPMSAFTEHGVIMLSAVLKSDVAVRMSVRITNTFVAMRQYLIANGNFLQQIDQLRRQQILDQNRNDERFETVFTALATGHLLPNGILPAGAEFDAMRYVVRLIKSATTEIVLIDPYSDAVTLEVLANKRPGVRVRLYCKDRGKPTPVEIAKFNRQYKDLTVAYTDDFHDRFLIIDNAELHGLGSSVNSLGRRVTTYASRDPQEIARLLSMVP